MAQRGVAADEREATTKGSLLDFLDEQRTHVLGILDGLDDAQLRQPVLPSGWSCLGLVNHLALDVERYWFSCIIGGGPLDSEPSEDSTRNWQVSASDTAAGILSRYRAEIAASNAVIRDTPLEAPPRQRDAWWGEWRVPDHRFVLLHVIAETACHAGHLDAARELLDGHQWMTL